MASLTSFKIFTFAGVLALLRTTSAGVVTNGLLTVSTDNCNPNATNGIDQGTQLLNAIQDANSIAHAGIIAAASPKSPPFSYFFYDDVKDTVVQRLQTVIDLTEKPDGLNSSIAGGIRPSIYVSCNDPWLCKERNQWGYTAFWGRAVGLSPSSQWKITICDFGLDNLQRNPLPCGTSPVGIPSLGWVALKFLLQMWDTVGGVGDFVAEPSNCHAMLTDVHLGPGSWANAENYAYMATWAYDMGLKTDGPYYGASCPDRWNPTPQNVLPQHIIDGQNSPASGGNG